MPCTLAQRRRATLKNDQVWRATSVSNDSRSAAETGWSGENTTAAAPDASLAAAATAPREVIRLVHGDAASGEQRPETAPRLPEQHHRSRDAGDVVTGAQEELRLLGRRMDTAAAGILETSRDEDDRALRIAREKRSGLSRGRGHTVVDTRDPRQGPDLARAKRKRCSDRQPGVDGIGRGAGGGGNRGRRQEVARMYRRPAPGPAVMLDAVVPDERDRRPIAQERSGAGGASQRELVHPARGVGGECG